MPDMGAQVMPVPAMAAWFACVHAQTDPLISPTPARARRCPETHEGVGGIQVGRLGLGREVVHHKVQKREERAVARCERVVLQIPTHHHGSQRVQGGGPKVPPSSVRKCVRTISFCRHSMYSIACMA